MYNNVCIHIYIYQHLQRGAKWFRKGSHGKSIILIVFTRKHEIFMGYVSFREGKYKFDAPFLTWFLPPFFPSCWGHSSNQSREDTIQFRHFYIESSTRQPNQQRTPTGTWPFLLQLCSQSNHIGRGSTCSQKGFRESFIEGFQNFIAFFNLFQINSLHSQPKTTYHCLNKTWEPFQDCIKLFFLLNSFAPFGFSHRRSSPGKFRRSPRFHRSSSLLAAACNRSLQQLPLFLQGTSLLHQFQVWVRFKYPRLL